MGDLTKNFTRWEFRCQCGCGYDLINAPLVKQIQRFRDLLEIYTGYGIPITISSGCRCEEHNKKVGGAKNSFHAMGLAADLAFSLRPMLDMGRIIQTANVSNIMNVGGIGVYPERNFIHLDVRPIHTATTWIKQDGEYAFNVDFRHELAKMPH